MKFLDLIKLPISRWKFLCPFSQSNCFVQFFVFLFYLSVICRKIHFFLPSLDSKPHITLISFTVHSINRNGDMKTPIKTAANISPGFILQSSLSPFIESQYLVPNALKLFLILLPADLFEKFSFALYPHLRITAFRIACRLSYSFQVFIIIYSALSITLF